jgi:putative FmdB family regulatory protein
MPTYDYACSDCGGFDAFRSVSQRNDACACPTCGGASTRVFVSTPWLACTSPEQRRAHETNEKAQHAPRSSKDTEGSYGRMRHPSGCGCCSTSARRSSTVTAPNGAKTFPTKRPWMISH